MSKALVRMTVALALFAGALPAGEEVEHLLRQTQLRFDLAVRILEHFEEAVADYRAAFESGRIPETEFHEVLLERDEAQAERDRLALDLEEMRATGREPRPEIVAPPAAGKDFVTARLAIDLELARRRLRLADRRAAEVKRLVEAQAGAADELLEVTGDLGAIRAEHEAHETLLKIRRAFVAGKMREAEAERQAEIAGLTAELTEAGIRSRLAAARVQRTRALFEIGRVTKAELREAQIDAARTKTEHEIVRLELERLKGEGAPRGGVELVFRVKADQRAEVLRTVTTRLATYGFEDMKLDPVGEDRFTIQVPATRPDELRRIKALVMTPGTLEFRITVEPKATAHHAHYWKLFAEARKKGVHEEIASFIGPDAVHRDDKARFPDGLRWYRVADEEKIGKTRWARDAKGEPQPWILCALDSYNVTGEHLYEVHHARDQGGLGTDWAIYFKVKKDAQEAMSKLTSYEEDKYMAIIVNGRVHAAPILQCTLSDTGQITGGFTRESARMLAAMLQAGALEHEPEFVSERAIER
jgi:hypothetical protein